MNPGNIRGLVTCSECKTPRILWPRYKPSGGGCRTITSRVKPLSEKGEFKCGFDIKPIFDDHVELKTKIVTVDRRLTCSIPIEKAFYSSDQFSGKNEICAFCTTELTSSDAKELKTLIQNEWKVQPSCGQPACLSLNPKANYNNGWTANEKTSRKRRQSAANQQPAKRRKKPSKPKRRKKSTGSNGKS